MTVAVDDAVLEADLPDSPAQMSVGPVASWAARAGAFAIDVLLGLGVVATALLVCGSAPPRGWLWWVTLVIGAAALLAVLVNRLLLPAATGWSLGRSVFGIAVVSRDGEAVGPWRLLLRDLAHILDTVPLLLGWLWPLLDSRGRTFADVAVRTEVHRVDGRRPAWTRRAVAILGAAGVVATLAAAAGYLGVYRQELAVAQAREQIAVQGPNARAKVWQVIEGSEAATAEMKPFNVAFVADTAFGEAMVARTGYTGEDGFEIGVAAEQAEALWNALAAAGVKPAGLGARDTLSLEAGMNLYGQDMDDSVNPLDAGLAWTIDLVSERDFIGKAALQAKGQNAQFVGLILREKGGVLRAHQKVIVAGSEATGEITSGTFSPSMQQAIALARVPMGVNVGDTVHVEIRDKKLAASVVKLPFVRNGKILAV